MRAVARGLFLLSPCYKSGGHFRPLAYNEPGINEGGELKQYTMNEAQIFDNARTVERSGKPPLSFNPLLSDAAFQYHSYEAHNLFLINFLGRYFL